jgi:hypothetical protein
VIVISGALVFVALVLLVIGLFNPELGFVYASIAVSAAALVFLLIGVLQRRGEDTASGAAPDAAPEPTAGEAAAAATVTTAAPAREEVPVADSDGAPEAERLGGTVLVVADRPRYHVEGCRYLAGKDAEEVDVTEAREEGFTPCGVCKPDAALAADAASRDTATEVVEVPAVDEEPVADEAPAVRTVRAPAEPRTGRAAAKAPARTAASRPTKAVKPEAAAPAKAPAKAAPAKAPAKTAAKAPAKAAAKAPAGGTVVVIPDRGKFHTPDCRYVRGVAGAEELSKAAAGRQGYTACGVCKP